MIAYNICFTTLLRNVDGVDKDLYNHFQIEQEEPIDAKPPSSDTFDYGDYMDESEDKEDKSKKVKRNYEFGFVKKDSPFTKNSILNLHLFFLHKSRTILLTFLFKEADV